MQDHFVLFIYGFNDAHRYLYKMVKNEMLRLGGNMSLCHKARCPSEILVMDVDDFLYFRTQELAHKRVAHSDLLD